MKQKRYWLRGGIVLLVLYSVVGIISFALLEHCSSTAVGLDGFSCLKYSIPLVIATGPIFEILNDFLPLSIIIVFNATIWTSLGIFLGWLYSKTQK